jgi:hypothetical protein
MVCNIYTTISGKCGKIGIYESIMIFDPFKEQNHIDCEKIYYKKFIV